MAPSQQEPELSETPVDSATDNPPVRPAIIMNLTAPWPPDAAVLSDAVTLTPWNASLSNSYNCLESR
jgi:hypothetical protein